MKLKKPITVSLLACLLLAGCAHIPGGITDSTVPIEGRKYVNLGRVKETDSYVLLLGFLPIFGSNSTRDCINSAISKRGGNAMINVVVESYWQCWILFFRQVILVDGEVIRFE